ncbi:Carbon monoxide oxidation accessory protein CoxG [Rhodovulum sp. P5]|uniref:CoxG family protein n=1 Tax=Rhodovulum sp. P5 TaxID=1564506 RepID=UPI0009C2E5CA|nr:carbon monoxide dehydrogenase subunit G [Rhodovulum sp. P5]ARE40765.1 Carbon monoxide oxidation accessory protein CoxG [Rhodovulum sp. P5]
MEFHATHDIAADRDTVWKALLSEDVLRDCVPGCKELSGSPEEGFDAVAVQKVGPVKATFKGHVSLSEMVEPQSLTLSGEGKGGAAGFAKGHAHVTLDEVEGGTQLSYQLEVEVGGKLAQLGSRIIHGVAHKLTDQFFTNFKAAVEEPEAEGEEPADETGAEDAAPETGKKKGWFGRLTGRKPTAEAEETQEN